MRMFLSIYIDLVKDLLIRLNRCQKQLFAIFCHFTHTTYTHTHYTWTVNMIHTHIAHACMRHLACANAGALTVAGTGLDIIILTMSLLNPFDFTHSFHFIIFPFIGISNQEQENTASTWMAHTHAYVVRPCDARASTHNAHFCMILLHIYNKFIHTWIHNKFNWFNT